MSNSYKSVERSGRIADVLSEAFMDIETLRDEMQEMEENMSGASMEHLPKYEVVSTALQELEDHCDQNVEVPPCLTGITVQALIAVATGLPDEIMRENEDA